MSYPNTIILESAILIYPVQYNKVPFTLTFKSAEAGRKIEVSTDGGIEYFIPVYDATSPTMLVTSILSPVSHIKVTGAISDKLILVG
jgi:hypothetical protein